MVNKRLYELIGVEVKEKLSKITSNGKYAGKKSYILLVKVENQPEIKKINVYLENLGLAGKIGQEKMWKDIEESNYADKRYLFYCHLDNYLNNRSYSLVGWKELENK